MVKKYTEISIVVCSKDRRDALHKLVSRLRAMCDTQTTEIVVVEETDMPLALDGTTYVAHPAANRGIPFARNLGLQNARGDIIVFVDDDCLIGEGWLEHLLRSFKDENVVGVQGGVSCPRDTNAIGWSESLLGFPGGGLNRIHASKGNIIATREISTLNCAYRRWSIDKVGGFEEGLVLGCEDYLLAKQVCAYGKCYFVPEAIAIHESRGSFPAIWTWFVRRGKAEIDLLRVGKQRDFSWIGMIQRSLSLKISLLTALAAGLGQFGTVCAVSLLIYMLLQYRRYFGVWRFSGSAFRVLLVIPIVKMVMDVAADWGRLTRVLYDERSI